MQLIVTTTSTTRAFLRLPAQPCGRPTPASDYRQLQRRLGLTRNVVVQPSTYGIDNRLLGRIGRTFGATARGIAMLDATVTAAELNACMRPASEACGSARACLVRLHGRHGPGGRQNRGTSVAHSLVSEGDRIVELESLLTKMPVPVVFDHMGHLPEPAGPQHAAFRVIADLIEKHGAWEKLAGAYILSKIGPPTYADRSHLARVTSSSPPSASSGEAIGPTPPLQATRSPMTQFCLICWPIGHRIRSCKLRSSSQTRLGSTASERRRKLRARSK